MAASKSQKIQAEIDKVKAKIAEQQARLKELEQKKLEAENSEIVDIVRGMSIPLAELPLLFEKLKGGGTLGQSVPKYVTCRQKWRLFSWPGISPEKWRLYGVLFFCCRYLTDPGCGSRRWSWRVGRCQSAGGLRLGQPRLKKPGHETAYG